MALTSAQLATLKTELNADPNAYGYAADLAVGNQEGVANKLNLRRDGTNGGPAITVRETAISTFALLEAIDNRDFITGTITQESQLLSGWFESITQGQSIALLDAAGQPNRVLGNLRRMLQNPGPQLSRSRVDALANRNGSRAEQLFGSGVRVTDADVANALALP